MSGLKTTSLPDAVYEALRESIVLGAIGPGTAVTENAVAAQFGVARPTVKAAIERLVSDGLLRREMHRVARVPQLGRRDIEDLYATRAILEEAAVLNLVADDVVPDEARTAHQAMLDVIGRGQTSFPQIDMLFHRSLVVAQRSPRLARMHALIMGEVELCIGQAQGRQLMPVPDIADQHQRILDAVIAGDGPLAGKLARQHVEDSRDHLLAGFDSPG
jgi:DNA-binding GntR family transcriptional regulator